MTEIGVVASNEGTTRVLTFDRPRVRNAIDRDTRRRFIELLQEADASPDVRAVVVTGRDPAFCAGVDFKALQASMDDGPPPGPNPAEAVRELATPVIAAVNGACVTGGLEIALSCDLVVASERATFADTHARLGLAPGKGMWGMSALLPGAVGERLAKELSLTGRHLDAEEAVRCGLVNRVVSHADLLPSTLELANAIAAVEVEVATRWLDIYDRGAGRSLTERLELEAKP